MSRQYAIYSCEGFAREVAPLVRAQSALTNDTSADIVFVDDDAKKVGSVIHNCQVVSFDDICNESQPKRSVSVAIADPVIRNKVVDKCADAGFDFFQVEHESHISGENCDIDSGAIFCANTILTGDLSIGVHFHCNIYSYVAHDCRIGDYVTFAPRVCCNGRVEIGDYAYVGTGALLKQGAHDKPLRIGKGAVIGMGAVVLDDVPDGAIVVGNPAKVLRIREIPAWE